MTDLAAMAAELIRARDLSQLGDDGGDTLRLVDDCVRTALEHLGVRVLDADGVRLDDRVHEVIGARDTTDAEADATVCETVTPGYALGARLLRPQQVVVYRLTEAGI